MMNQRTKNSRQLAIGNWQIKLPTVHCLLLIVLLLTAYCILHTDSFSFAQEENDKGAFNNYNLKYEIASLIASMRDLKNKNELLQKQCNKLTSSLENLKNENSELSATLEEFSKQRDLWKKEKKKISEFAATLKEVQSKKLSLQTELENSQKDLKQKEEEISNLSKSLKKKEDVFADLSFAVKNKEGRIQKLETELKELREKFQKLSESKTQEIPELISKLKEKEKELDKTNKSLEKRDAQLRLAEKKLADFQQKVHKERLSVHYNLGVIYDKSGMYLEALKEYEKALAVDPQDPDTHYNLAILYDDHLDDNRVAIRHYQEYLRLRPNAEDAEQVREWVIRAERDLGITKPSKEGKK